MYSSDLVRSVHWPIKKIVGSSSWFFKWELWSLYLMVYVHAHEFWLSHWATDCRILPSNSYLHCSSNFFYVTCIWKWHACTPEGRSRVAISMVVASELVLLGDLGIHGCRQHTQIHKWRDRCTWLTQTSEWLGLCKERQFAIYSH